MLKNSEFTDLLRGLAERHLQIKHTAQKKAFTKVILSADPVAKQVSLSNFYSKLKASFGAAPFLVAMSYDAVHEDKGDGAMLAHRRAGFMILQTASNTDAARDEVLDRTEEIGYEVMAAVGEAFRGPLGRRKGRMLNYGSLAVDSIGPLSDGFCGTRFEFDFTESATLALTYDATKFLP
jgi:hypothetical protein